MHAEVVEALRYDKSDRGRGRHVVRDIPNAGLLKYDRLEPTPAMPDPASFDTCTVFPVAAIFWRRAFETIAIWRCPLWSPAIGLTPYRAMSIDVLHALYFGSRKNFVEPVVSECIRSGL